MAKMTDAGRAKLDKLRVRAGPQLDLPWGGRSPRVLTKAYERFTLKREQTTVMAESELDDAQIDEQCRRHFNGS